MLQINQVLESLLNRGFKASKCKTLLKLTSSRINVLRNKRSIHLKQLRKELAKLLENDQEATAQIKVEHIIREQNIQRVHDKLNIFCELLIIRMPIIESQRECPIDLQEAIASLIFSAPRLSDLPELMEIQQLLSSKYGPEFTAAAAEVRPDCQVNRLIIESLSVQTPSIKVKLDVMKEVAEEHGVATNFELQNSNESQEPLKQDVTRKFIEPIQMLPIPLLGMSNLREVGSSLPEASYPPSTEGNINFQESNGLNDPKFGPFSATNPNRFYSPPRESSITQRSDLLEETFLERTHSRTKSEGSLSLQDIIDAAEAAAESAEMAAQAARAAAELARSRICSRPDKRQEYICSMNPPVVAHEISSSIGKLGDTGEDRPKEKGGSVDLSFKHENSPGLSEQRTIDEEDGAHQNVLDRKVNFQAIADSYDWSEKCASKESGHSSEEDVSGNNHAANVFRRNDYASNCADEKKADFHMELDDNHDWSSQERAAAHDIDGRHIAYDSIESNPFSEKAAHNLSKNTHLPSVDTASRFGHYEENRDGSFPEFDGPKFDHSRPGSYQEPIHRSQSLEDDPYYTYPNLFS